MLKTFFNGYKKPVWVIEDFRKRQFSDWLLIHPLLALPAQPQLPDHDDDSDDDIMMIKDDDKDDDQSYDDDDDDVNNDENAT